MKIHWRYSAIMSLDELDQWRDTLELSSIALFLKERIEVYFYQQDFHVYIPGKQVIVGGLPVDLRMILISVGKSDPYKIFYRLKDREVEIFLVRHPYQKPL